MVINDILSHCDHTLLKQTSTWKDIKRICDEGITYRTASVCIPPSYVKQAKEYVGGRLKICTVIGFPNGYSTTAVKLFETADALAGGADEIDMVINICELKNGNYDYVEEEIKALKRLCGSRVLKVIIETCLLTDDEKIRMCKIVTNAGADYIKTSTGFSLHGATREDIMLMRKNVGSDIKVKAAGGISGIDDAKEYISLGADRIGTSRVIEAVKNAERGLKNG